VLIRPCFVVSFGVIRRPAAMAENALTKDTDVASTSFR
jgi:hypothetical protein